MLDTCLIDLGVPPSGGDAWIQHQVMVEKRMCDEGGKDANKKRNRKGSYFTTGSSNTFLGPTPDVIFSGTAISFPWTTVLYALKMSNTSMPRGSKT